MDFAISEKLIPRLKLNFIVFGSDGLSDTNHIYGRNTQWKFIMDSARTFIDAGGQAIWDFIVFEHNQHQVEKARTLSATLGFSKFNIPLVRMVIFR